MAFCRWRGYTPLVYRSVDMKTYGVGSTGNALAVNCVWATAVSSILSALKHYQVFNGNVRISSCTAAIILTEMNAVITA